MPSAPPAPKTALVIVGMCGSGKSTLAEFLSARKWPMVRFGSVTIDELKRRGLPIQEATERSVREELRKKHGMAAFAALSLPAIEEALERRRKVVIDGLYSWSEYKHLHDRLKARLLVVAVFTPRRARYERLASRSVRPLTAEEAESRDVAEIERIEKGGPIALADFTLLNGGTVGDLEQSLLRILEAEGVEV